MKELKVCITYAHFGSYVAVYPLLILEKRPCCWNVIIKKCAAFLSIQCCCNYTIIQNGIYIYILLTRKSYIEKYIAPQVGALKMEYLKIIIIIYVPLSWMVKQCIMIF